MNIYIGELRLSKSSVFRYYTYYRLVTLLLYSHLYSLSTPTCNKCNIIGTMIKENESPLPAVSNVLSSIPPISNELQSIPPISNQLPSIPPISNELPSEHILSELYDLPIPFFSSESSPLSSEPPILSQLSSIPLISNDLQSEPSKIQIAKKS